MMVYLPEDGVENRIKIESTLRATSCGCDYSNIAIDIACYEQVLVKRMSMER